MFSFIVLTISLSKRDATLLTGTVHSRRSNSMVTSEGYAMYRRHDPYRYQYGLIYDRPFPDPALILCLCFSLRVRALFFILAS